MASTLIIRDIPGDVQAILQTRAAVAGRSVEAEALEILTSTCLLRRSDDWWRDLSGRRDARTANRLELESAELIREGRDERVDRQSQRIKTMPLVAGSVQSDLSVAPASG